MRRILGLRPVRHDVPRLHLAKYINRSTIVLPQTQPLNIGYSNVIPGMLVNGPDPLNPPQIKDGIGCCFWAASVRAAFARGVSAGKYQGANLNQAWAVASVLEGYASTGFDINNPGPTDNGTDPDQGFTYLKATGVKMPDGTYDKLGVPVAVNAKDWEELIIAHRLFGGLYIGVQFPDVWEDAQIWDQLASPNIAGGHEIFGFSDVNITPNGLGLDTWGEERIITPAGMAQFCDQLTIAVDPGFFGPNGKAINGFDAEQLQADEAAL